MMGQGAVLGVPACDDGLLGSFAYYRSHLGITSCTA